MANHLSTPPGVVRTQPIISGINDYRVDYIFAFFTTECLWLNERVLNSCAGAVMAGASRHDNAQSSVPFNVATVEKSSPFYGNHQPIPRRTTCSGESVAVLCAAI